MIKLRFKPWRFCAALGLVLNLSGSPVLQAGEATNAKRAVGLGEGKERFSLNSLLPQAWQKRPEVHFNVFTEMSPEGRKRPQPSSEKPLYYHAPPGVFAQPGWQPSAGEKPPPWQELQAAMEKALEANGYLPLPTESKQLPDLLIVFKYGSFATDLAQLAVYPLSDPRALMPVEDMPTSAEELYDWMLTKPPLGPLYDVKAIEDVLERARFIGGPKAAAELQESFIYLTHAFLLAGAKGETMAHVAELAARTCYFVTATAYDFSGVAKKQQILLWQTRMTTDAQGVAIAEVLKPLIINTGAFIGRETSETVIVHQRLDREGKVEIGTMEVVREPKEK